MKNFNRCNAIPHGDHGSKHRELAQHTHSSESHAFTHTLRRKTPTAYQLIGYHILQEKIQHPGWDSNPHLSNIGDKLTWPRAHAVSDPLSYRHGGLVVKASAS